MAIFRLEVSVVSRSTGRSAVAAAAYRAGERLADLRTGLVHDYRRRCGVLASGLVGWHGARESLWQTAEAAEKRKDARVAREVLLAFPHELTSDSRVDLVRKFAHELRERHGIAIDWSVHTPDRHGDSRNHHSHLLLTTRRSDGRSLGAKARELDDKATGPQAIEAWRVLWADFCNEALAKARVEIRVDHRSLKRQATINGKPVLLPQAKLGPAATAMERRGLRTRLGNENRRRRRLNAAVRRVAKELGRLTSRIAMLGLEFVLGDHLAAEEPIRERGHYIDHSG